MSKNRTNPKSGWAKKADTEKRGPNGRCLCRRCGVEVPKGRRTFCGEVCVHEWMIRSNTEYLRRCVFKRDKGVCAECKLDTYQMEIGLHRLRRTDYSAYVKRRSELTAKGFDSHRSTFWDAEHKLAVVEGGGECGLENIETLCQPCHKQRTRNLAARRAAARRAAAELRGGSADSSTVQDLQADVAQPQDHQESVCPDGAVQVPPNQEETHPPQMGDAS